MFVRTKGHQMYAYQEALTAAAEYVAGRIDSPTLIVNAEIAAGLCEGTSYAFNPDDLIREAINQRQTRIFDRQGDAHNA